MRLPSLTKLRTLVPLFALVAATAVIAGPALGQVDVPTKPGELSDAQCYGHHREEGFRSMDLFADEIQQVKQGEEFPVTVTILVPWLHDLIQPVAFVNISGMPGARFPGEKEPFAAQAAGELAPANAGPLPLGGAAGASTAEHAFPVDANATEAVVTLVGEPGQSGRNAWSLTVLSPAGEGQSTNAATFPQTITSSADRSRHTIRVPYENLTRGGPGEWRAVVSYDNGAEAPAPYSLDVQVYYNLSKSSELLVPGPAMLNEREQHTFSFTVIAPSEPMAEAVLIYGGKGIANHFHTDPNAEDFGNYTKWNVMTFSVGSETHIAGIVFRPPAADPGPIMRSYAQILGFTSSFLLIPAIFLGGTFGSGSVRVLNKLLSARRRVLWHNATSYLLLATALLHMYLFLLENFWEWSHGVVWGGLSLAAMIGLAVTGAFQRRLVAKWGFERWRFSHFSLGIVVIGFVLVHVLADGSHLGAVREWMATL